MERGFKPLGGGGGGVVFILLPVHVFSQISNLVAEGGSSERRLWVHVTAVSTLEAVLMCAYDLCFGQK